MKQVCELSEDAARRVMSSTCSVSTSRSLAGLGRSSGQCGHPSLHTRTRTPFEPEHRSTQQGTAIQRATAQPIRKLSPTALFHTFASARRSVFRESREIFFRNFFGRQRTLGRWTVVALAALPPWSVNTKFHLLRGAPPAHSPAGCLIKNTDKFIYALQSQPARDGSDHLFPLHLNIDHAVSPALCWLWRACILTLFPKNPT